MSNFVFPVVEKEYQESFNQNQNDVIDRIIKGAPPKYDEVYHITLLFELFRTGRDIAAFCAICSISRTTFYYWRRNHEAFKEAYDIAIEYARNYHENIAHMGLSDPSFNNTLWSMIARNRFGYTEHRRLDVGCIKENSNYTEQCKQVFKCLSEGNLTAQEANQLANLIATTAKVDELTIMRKEIEELKQLVNRGNNA